MERYGVAGLECAMFSVVIPAKNEEKYLPACIESIKRQAGSFCVEIIVVNNGSVDKTKEIAESSGAKVIDELVCGVGMARKAGTEAAQGEFVVNLDADSRLPEDYLLKARKMFDENKDLVCLGGQLYFFDGTWLQDFLRLIFYRPICWFVRAVSFGRVGPTGNCMVLKKTTYNKTNGFDENLKYGEDGDLTIKLSKFGKIKINMDLKCFISSRRFNILDKGFWAYVLNAVGVLFTGKPVKNELRTTEEKKKSG